MIHLVIITIGLIQGSGDGEGGQPRVPPTHSTLHTHAHSHTGTEQQPDAHPGCAGTEHRQSWLLLTSCERLGHQRLARPGTCLSPGKPTQHRTSLPTCPAACPCCSLSTCTHTADHMTRSHTRKVKRMSHSVAQWQPEPSVCTPGWQGGNPFRLVQSIQSFCVFINQLSGQP